MLRVEKTRGDFTMSDCLPNWLSNRAFLTPDRVAVVEDERKITFKELHLRVTKVANQLTTAGIVKDDTVSVLMKNGIEMIEVIFALKYIGATTVLLNTRLSSLELIWQITDSRSKFIITEETLFGKIHKEEHSAQFLKIEEVSMLPETICDYEKVFSMDKVDTIMYTSGTTGKPKGVMQTYGNHWWSAIGSALNLGLHHNDKWLVIVPIFHISGLSILMRGVIYGITIVLQSKFDPIEANKAIYREKITIVSVVSAMLTKMTELLNQAYPDSFRCMLLGGGPVPLPLLEKCRQLNIPVFQTYGMTETSSQIVTLAPEHSIAKLGSAGKALFPSQVAIDVNGRAAAAKEHGEIIVKGPNVTKGYYNRIDATESSFRNGWFHTGDLGYIDEDGFLFVLDRRSDLIVSGGENIYPAEIESILLEHPDVMDAGVTGIENEQWGHVPIAFIVSSRIMSEQEIIQYCQHKLARYKIPKSVHFVKSLPRNAAKKLLRRQLLSLLK